jgi:hypothetical protein
MATNLPKRFPVILMYLGMATSLKVAVSSGGRVFTAPDRRDNNTVPNQAKGDYNGT